MVPPIFVWRYRDAPKVLRDLSDYGNEDWLAEVPPHVDYIPWMEGGTFDAGHKPQRIPHPTRDGWVVVIGSH